MRISIFKSLVPAAWTLFLCGGLCYSLHAQPDATLDVKKPAKFENRVLGSDKTFTSKFTLPRRLNQNLITHYNFFFNASNKLNDILAGAKESFRDDYTELLPFYNYTLETTSAQKIQLDSVLYKCNAGIMLHDLRNDWIDNFYLLMGKAYFFRKQFDSANIAFQYLNYYFQPKKKDELGYKKYVGSNLNDEGNVYSVTTREKKSLTSRIFTEPPSRNDALIWLVRNHIEDSSYSEAAGLIETLKLDQNFPERLKPSLYEVKAYWFYKNEMWDSAANNLVLALNNAANAGEKSRWEYLAGQLYAMSGKADLSYRYFDLAIRHTVDPVMDVYARLNQIRLSKGSDDQKLIDENIKELLKMAHRDKYENYRNIIYYTAAQMEMQRNNFLMAQTYLRKSVQFNNGDMDQRNRSFLYLGDLAYDRKYYQLAHDCYDSLDVSSPVIKHADSLIYRKQVLYQVVSRLKMISVEDSLQHIASLPEADRDKLIKGLEKKLRKEKGLKESDSSSVNSNNPFANKAVTDIFGTNEKGEWYFNNMAMKSSGFTEFRKNWGNRPNVDNWRRLSEVNARLNMGGSQRPTAEQSAAPDNSNLKTNPTDISYAGLLKNLPLTPDAIRISNDSIQSAYFGLGKIFKDKLEFYSDAIDTYENLLKRFPNTPHREEIYFDLYYCYSKLGEADKAKQYRNLLAENFSQSSYVALIDNPKLAEQEQDAVKVAATKSYEAIYNLFIEGNFDEALKQKKTADSLFGKKYWNPQLLYIESIYYIKQKQDQEAIATLNSLISLNPNAPMAKKAETLVGVLKRRKEIESYLTNLKVERMKEDTVIVFNEPPKPVPVEQVRNDNRQKSAAGPPASKIRPEPLWIHRK